MTSRINAAHVCPARACSPRDRRLPPLQVLPDVRVPARSAQRDRHTSARVRDAAAPAVMEAPAHLEDQVFGVDGQDYLADVLHTTPPADVPALLGSFRARNQLVSPGVGAALSLLEMGGVRRRHVHLAVISALRDALLERVKEAGRRGDQELLRRLFDEVQQYVLVKEMAPVVMAVMEAGDDVVVSEAYWQMLADHDKDYTELYPSLTLVLKARMWVRFPAAFQHEVREVLRGVVDFAPPRTVADLFRPDYYNENGRNAELVAKLVGLVRSAKEFEPVPRIVEVLEQEMLMPNVGENRGVALANLLLDFLTQEEVASGGVGTELDPFYKDMAAAARVVTAQSFEEGGVLISLQDINTLAIWAKGLAIGSGEVQPERVRVMALLLHSSHARNLFANKLASQLTQFRAAPGDNLAERLWDDPFLQNLTFLTLTTIKAKEVVEMRRPVPKAVVRAPFDVFYPVLVADMRHDRMWMRDPNNAYMRLPDPALLAATRNGLLEKRVMCSYGYMIAQPMGDYGIYRTRLSRLRLVFDSILDPSMHTVEGEEREQVLSDELISLATEDA
jgi:hypothetical protein